jgi:2-methylisocitrate lyase-like PEP mutase family enzyme
LGCRVGEALRRARLPGFGHHELRFCGHTRAPRRLCDPRRNVGATELPVSADLENGFADDPASVAETISLAATTGLAGCSIEDYSGKATDRLYEAALAAERIAAAAEAAHAADAPLVLTARAENLIRGRPDLADTIARLQAFQAAGADVLYAPGLTDLADIRSVVESVDLPVNECRSAVHSATSGSAPSRMRRANFSKTAPTGSGSKPPRACNSPVPPSLPETSPALRFGATGVR